MIRTVVFVLVLTLLLVPGAWAASPSFESPSPTWLEESYQVLRDLGAWLKEIFAPLKAGPMISPHG